MIDLHCHLLPAVDDGAANLAEAQAALGRMVEAGAGGIVVTPHVNASSLRRADDAEATRALLEAAWQPLVGVATQHFPALRLYRGSELMLDYPAPDLDRDWIRLAATRYVLVEFPALMIPTRAIEALASLARNGYVPVVSHPERYRNAGPACEEAVEWRGSGVRLQVNCGSLIGLYGPDASRRAWALLASGSIDYLASDYHARGRFPLEECRRVLEEEGGQEQSTLLLCTNPARLLEDQDPLEVPPLPGREPRWIRIVRKGKFWTS